MSLTINGISVPDSAMARQATELVRDTESDLLFHHSSRVYYWAALAGQQRKLAYDPELLYVGCLFHDMGLTHDHCSCDKRFEVDGADAAGERPIGLGGVMGGVSTGCSDDTVDVFFGGIAAKAEAD